MDSFFKAAVCDLDQLLDEFELHTDELDCKSVYLKPPSYPYSSSLGSSQCYSSSSDDSTTVARNLPDLNALHYDSALRSSSSSNQHYHPPPTTTTTGSEEEEEEERRGGGGEVKGLTGVDLLSSVDRRPSPAAPPPPPPCPDRALKPLCDLVSDASSAMMVNNNNHHHGHAHDAFGELDVEERRMEEDGEEEELLVDFGSPVVTAAAMPGEEDGGGRLSLGGGVDNERTSGGLLGALLGGLDSLQPVGGYGASLSLLDVILPAAVERGGGESADGGSPPQNAVVAQSAEKEAEEEVDMTCMMTPQRAEPSSSSLDHCQRKSSVHFAADNNVRDDFTTVRHKEDERREQHDDDDEKPPATTTPPDPSASEAGGGLSCLSMCGALVNGRTPRDDDDDDDDERAQTAARQGGVDSSLAPSAPREESADTSSSKLLVNDATGSSGSSVVSTDGSVAAQQALIVSQSQNVAHSSRPADGGVSLAAEQQQQLRPEPPGAPAAAFDAVASSHRPSEPVPKNNPTSSSSSSQFVFDYLPESEQAELLVTDEELDAFLRAHSEAERRQQHGGEEDGGGGVFYQSGLGQWSQDEGFSEGFNGDLEERLVEEELKSCVKEEGRRKEEERGGGLEERDKTTSVVAVEGSFNPTLPSLSQEPEPVSSTGQSDTSGPTQNHGGFESHSSYGGARPKQTQAPRSPPMAGEEQTPGDSLKDPAPPPVAPPDEENGLSSSSPSNPGGPPPVEEGAPSSSSSSDGNKEPPCPPPAYCPQEHYEDSVAYDELSEPPPYHATGPPPGEEGGAGGTQEEEMEGLGCKQPNWVPDSEAPNCMNCWQRFTFTRRRHHCRACGKVYCAVCCNRKCKLKYLEKEARVCITCFDTIHRGCPREQKRVWFADGILPNGEVADTTKLTLNTSRRSPQDADPHTSGSEGGAEDGLSSMPEACGAAEMVRPLVAGPWDFALLCGVGPSVRKTPSLLPDNEGEELPPLLITTGEEGPGDVLVEEGPAPCQILLLLEEGGPRPLTFVVNANLLVHVKLVTYCSRRCWCLVSCGLQALGQKELVFLLECLPEEKTLPKDLFTLYLSIYQDAQKGKFIEALGNVTFTSSFLGSKEHGGMLFFSPTCQPTEGLTLPPQPVLVGLLIQRLEVPWAKVFPLRLLLRLGAEHSVYPTTLVSIRFRRSVYRETGHTIMNLLADLRNYQYSLPAVEGLRIHMEMGHSYIDIPKSRFTEMLKVINSSNEHVISVGASFSLEADSHLVCFQNEEGNYQTQANSMPGKTRTVTGASFVVFNGALKASSGFIAKSSIVEDGLMVQIPPDTMEALRVALREQTDLHIPCGKNDGGEVRENVTVRWVDWTAPLNTGIKSGVDGRPLDTAHRVRLQQDAEFESEGRTIRCTEVFYELKDPECCLNTVLSSCSVFQSEMAIAACTALTPHLTVLAAGGINALCLRVSTQTDMVEYQAGWGGRLLPQRYMNELDSALIPVIHGGSASVPHTSMDMEFVFYITHTLTQI